MNALYLAFSYLRYHWARSLVLVLVAALIMFVPVATQTLLSTSERALIARGEATPLLLGSRGSQLDLTMAALYFSDERPAPIAMGEVEAVWDSGLGTPIPVHSAFSSGGFRIVGTTLDYFDFRGLTLEDGRGLSILGDAVIGSDVAEALGKGVGDALVSAPKISSISTVSIRWRCRSSVSLRRQIRRTIKRYLSISRQLGLFRALATGMRMLSLRQMSQKGLLRSRMLLWSNISASVKTTSTAFTFTAVRMIFRRLRLSLFRTTPGRALS
jgi:hypothetical protein